MNDAWITQELKGIADQFRTQLRSPMLSTPTALNLDYEDVTFPSEAGVPLEVNRSGSVGYFLV